MRAALTLPFQHHSTRIGSLHRRKKFTGALQIRRHPSDLNGPKSDLGRQGEPSQPDAAAGGNNEILATQVQILQQQVSQLTSMLLTMQQQNQALITTLQQQTAMQAMQLPQTGMPPGLTPPPSALDPTTGLPPQGITQVPPVTPSIPQAPLSAAQPPLSTAQPPLSTSTSKTSHPYPAAVLGVVKTEDPVLRAQRRNPSFEAVAEDAAVQPVQNAKVQAGTASGQVHPSFFLPDVDAPGTANTAPPYSPPAPLPAPSPEPPSSSHPFPSAVIPVPSRADNPSFLEASAVDFLEEAVRAAADAEAYNEVMGRINPSFSTQTPTVTPPPSSNTTASVPESTDDFTIEFATDFTEVGSREQPSPSPPTTSINPSFAAWSVADSDSTTQEPAESVPETQGSIGPAEEVTPSSPTLPKFFVADNTPSSTTPTADTQSSAPTESPPTVSFPKWTIGTPTAPTPTASTAPPATNTRPTPPTSSSSQVTSSPSGRYLAPDVPESSEASTSGAVSDVMRPRPHPRAVMADLMASPLGQHLEKKAVETKNLSAAHKRILAARTWKEAREAMERQAKVQPEDIVLFLQRLTDLAKEAGEDEQTPIQECATKSIARLIKPLNRMSPQSISTVLAAAATLKVRWPQKLPATFLEASQPLLPIMDAQQLSTVIWAASKEIQTFPSEWIASFIQRARQAVPQMDPTQLARVTSALPSLRLSPQLPITQEVIQVVETSWLQQVDQMPAQDYVEGLKGLQLLGLKPGAKLQTRLISRAEAIIRELDSGSLVQVFQVFVDFGVEPSRDLVAQCGEAVEKVVGSADAAGVALMLEVLATWKGSLSDEGQQAVSSALVKCGVHTLLGPQVSRMFSSLSQLKVSLQPEAQSTLASAAEKRMLELSPEELLQVLLGLTTWGTPVNNQFGRECLRCIIAADVGQNLDAPTQCLELIQQLGLSPELSLLEVLLTKYQTRFLRLGPSATMSWLQFVLTAEGAAPVQRPGLAALLAHLRRMAAGLTVEEVVEAAEALTRFDVNATLVLPVGVSAGGMPAGGVTSAAQTASVAAGPSQQELLRVKDVVDAVLTTVLSLPRAYNLKQYSRLLQAVSTMRYKPTSAWMEPVLDCVGSQSAAGTASLPELSSLVTSCLALHQQPPAPLSKAFTARLRGSMKDMDPERLASLVPALAALAASGNATGAAVVNEAVKQVGAGLPTFTPSLLAQIANSLATAGFKPPEEWIARLAWEAGKKLPGFTTQACVDVVYALACWGYGAKAGADASLLSKLSERVVKGENELAASGLADGLWALTQLGLVMDKRKLTVWLSKVQLQLGRLSGLQLVNLVSTLGKLKHAAGDRWLSDCVKSVGAKLDTLGCTELYALLQGLKQVSYTPPAAQLQQLLKALNAVSEDFTPSQVEGLVDVLSSWGVGANSASSSLLDRYAAQVVEAKAGEEDVDGETLSQHLCRLALCGFKPGSDWAQSAATAVAPQLLTLPAERSSTLLWALAKLNYVPDTQLLTSCLTQLSGSYSSLPPVAQLQLLWAATRLGAEPPAEVLAAAQSTLVKNSSAVSVQVVVDGLWALARLGVTATPALSQAITKGLSSKLGSLNVSQCAALGWALAKLQVKVSDQLVDNVGNAVTADKDAITDPETAALALEGLIGLDYRIEPEFVEKLLMTFVLEPQDLSGYAHTAALLGMAQYGAEYKEEWVTDFCSSILPKLSGAHVTQLVDVAVAWSLLQYKISPEAVVQFTSHLKVDQLSALTHTQYLRLVCALAEWENKPEGEWLEALSATCQSQLAPLAGEQLVAVLEAAAVLKFPASPELLAAFESRIMAKLPVLSSLECGSSLLSLYKLGHTPSPAYVAALSKQVASKTPSVEDGPDMAERAGQMLEELVQVTRGRPPRPIVDMLVGYVTATLKLMCGGAGFGQEGGDQEQGEDASAGMLTALPTPEELEAQLEQKKKGGQGQDMKETALGAMPDEYIQNLQQLQRTALVGLPPPVLCSTLSSLADIALEPTPAFQHYLWYSSGFMLRNYGAEQLVQLAKYCAVFKLTPPQEWVVNICSLVEERVDVFDVEQLSQLAYSLGVLGTAAFSPSNAAAIISKNTNVATCSGVCLEAAGRCLVASGGLLSRSSPQDLAVLGVAAQLLNSALPAAGSKQGGKRKAGKKTVAYSPEFSIPNTWRDAYLSTCQAAFATASASDLSAMVYSVSRLQWAPSKEWLQAWVQAASGVVDEMAPTVLVHALTGLRVLGAQEAGAQLVPQVYPQVDRVAEELSDHQLLAVVVAVGYFVPVATPGDSLLSRLEQECARRQAGSGGSDAVTQAAALLKKIQGVVAKQ